MSYTQHLQIAKILLEPNKIPYSPIPQQAELWWEHQIIAFIPSIKIFIKCSPTVKLEFNSNITYPVLHCGLSHPLILDNLKLAHQSELFSYINLEKEIQLLDKQTLQKLINEVKEKKIEKNTKVSTKKISPKEFELNQKKAKDKSDNLVLDLHNRYTPESYLTKFNEAVFETAITFFPENFGLTNWFLHHRQYSLNELGRIDLIYKNSEGTHFKIVELEVGSISKDHFSKSRIYRRQYSKENKIPLENITIHLVANGCHQTIKEECDDLKMTYSIMPMHQLQELIKKIPPKVDKQDETIDSQAQESQTYLDNSSDALIVQNHYGKIMNGKDYKSYLQRQSINRSRY